MPSKFGDASTGSQRDKASLVAVSVARDVGVPPCIHDLFGVVAVSESDDVSQLVQEHRSGLRMAIGTSQYLLDLRAIEGHYAADEDGATIRQAKASAPSYPDRCPMKARRLVRFRPRHEYGGPTVAVTASLEQWSS